jgi:hypothetical protein
MARVNVKDRSTAITSASMPLRETNINSKNAILRVLSKEWERTGSTH